MWKKVNIARELYACDELHLSHSTASCDGVRLPIFLSLIEVYLTWKINGIEIKYTQDLYVLLMVALSYYCCRSSLLRNGIAVYEL